MCIPLQSRFAHTAHNLLNGGGFCFQEEVRSGRCATEDWTEVECGPERLDARALQELGLGRKVDGWPNTTRLHFAVDDPNTACAF